LKITYIIEEVMKISNKIIKINPDKADLSGFKNISTSSIYLNMFIVIQLVRLLIIFLIFELYRLILS